MSHRNDRTLDVGALARVEGEGAMHVRVAGAPSSDVRLEIYEPPRFFEAFLRGRRHTEPPDITARICGICPVAYQMSACLAIEDACGVEVTAPIADLRRLLYCGEWIESHALHIYLLHAPDFLGYTSALDLAEDRRDLRRARAGAEEGRQRDHGAGRRPGDPPGQRPGRRLLPGPGQPEMAAAGREAARRARPGAGHRATGWPGSSSPTSITTTRCWPWSRPGRYAIDRGTVATTGGLTFAPARVRGARDRGARAALDRAARPAGRRGRYLTGPAARYTLSRQWLSPAGAGRPPTRRASAPSAATRTAASWSAPSRWCTRWTRRCG